MHVSSAISCVGLTTLNEYLNELKDFDIEVYENHPDLFKRKEVSKV